MAVNKVVMNTQNGEQTLIDLTNDTVIPSMLAEGATAHDASGTVIRGVMPTTTVLYTKQNLNADQKAQVRENIGAISEDDVKSTLIVTVNDDGETASHTSKQIYDWVQSGGNVVLDVGYYVNLAKVEEGCATFVDTCDDLFIYHYSIIDDGSYYFSETEAAFAYNSLPWHDEDNNGQILRVVDGTPTWSDVASTLIVTLDEDREKASHTPKQIYDWVQAGGSAVLHEGTLRYQLVSADEHYTAFTQLSDDGFNYCYTIDDEGYCNYYEMQPASADWVSELSATVDSALAKADGALELADDLNKDISNLLQKPHLSAEDVQHQIDDSLANIPVSYVTPQMFGAVGDGVTDDSNAFIAALNTGKALYLPKASYYCPVDLVLPKNTIIFGNQSTMMDCVLCINEGTDIRDIKITGTGYIAISTDKAKANIIDVSLRGVLVNTSAETAILFEVGGTASRYIYNVNISDVRIDGAVKYGVRFKHNYNNVSTSPWITCVNVSDVFLEQFESAILFDYSIADGYSFDAHPPVVTNSIMSFTNVRGQWTGRSKHFIDCSHVMTNINFADSYPVDYYGADGARMFQLTNMRFKNTSLYSQNIHLTGENYWVNSLYEETEILETTNKTLDFFTIFGMQKDAVAPSRILFENRYVSNTRLKENSAVVCPVSSDNWRGQVINKYFGVGIKMIPNYSYGGETPTIGANVLGHPFVDTSDGTHLILSGKYMPIFYGGNVNYAIPTNPCTGYMIFNGNTNKPMWWTGAFWVYADGTPVPSDNLA